MPDKTFSIGSNPSTGGSHAVIRTGGYQAWRVTQVSNNAPAATGLASLQKNGVQITPMIASNGVAGGDPPVDLYPSETMTVEWDDAGVSGDVRVQYEVIG
jgi:hypothetical protein